MKKLLCALCMCFAVACVAQDSQVKQTKKSVNSQTGNNENKEPIDAAKNLAAIKKSIIETYEGCAEAVTEACGYLKNYKKGTDTWKRGKAIRDDAIKTMIATCDSQIKDLHDADRKEAQALIDSKVAELTSIGGGMPKETCAMCKGKGHPQGKITKCSACNGTGKI